MLTALKKGFICLQKWRLTFFELATTLKNLGAKWLSEKKLISCPEVYLILVIKWDQRNEYAKLIAVLTFLAVKDYFNYIFQVSN